MQVGAGTVAMAVMAVMRNMAMAAKGDTVILLQVMRNMAMAAKAAMRENPNPVKD